MLVAPLHRFFERFFSGRVGSQQTVVKVGVGRVEACGRLKRAVFLPFSLETSLRPTAPFDARACARSNAAFRAARRRSFAARLYNRLRSRPPAPRRSAATGLPADCAPLLQRKRPLRPLIGPRRSLRERTAVRTHFFPRRFCANGGRSRRAGRRRERRARPGCCWRRGRSRRGSRGSGVRRRWRGRRSGGRGSSRRGGSRSGRVGPARRSNVGNVRNVRNVRDLGGSSGTTTTSGGSGTGGQGRRAARETDCGGARGRLPNSQRGRRGQALAARGL